MWATGSLSKIASKSVLNTVFKGLRFKFIDCATDHGPRCPKFSKIPIHPKEDCKLKSRISELIKPTKSYVSVWQDPDFCKKVCKEHYVRHDDLYLKANNKKTREYQQTWVECPISKKFPVVCYNPPADVLEPEKRKSKGPFTGTCEKYNKIPLLKCRLPDDYPCTKIRMPGCISTRGCPRCTKGRAPLKCKKLCTPYPSYSECDWKKMKEFAYAHCKCLIIPERCELYEAMSHEEKLNKLKPPKHPEPKKLT